MPIGVVNQVHLLCLWANTTVASLLQHMAMQLSFCTGNEIQLLYHPCCRRCILLHQQWAWGFLNTSWESLTFNRGALDICKSSTLLDRSKVTPVLPALPVPEPWKPGLELPLPLWSQGSAYCCGNRRDVTPWKPQLLLRLLTSKLQAGQELYCNVS